jgi:hypothetical protein
MPIFAWVLTACIGPQTERKILIEFLRKLKAFGRGWRRIPLKARLSGDKAKDRCENSPRALLGWLAACATVWSAFFVVGNFVYDRLPLALFLAAVFVVAGATLLCLMSQLFADNSVSYKLDPIDAENPVSSARRQTSLTKP